MASAELRQLHKLHQIDMALLEIRKRAAALDPGRKTAAEIQTIEHEIAESDAKKLQSEQSDLELRQKSLDEKIKKHDKDLYGGKVVNPREVEAIQKEISILKKQRGELDERILEIWEAMPPAKSQLEKLDETLNAKKALLNKEHRAALQAKTQLEAEFKEKSAQRPETAKTLPPTLLMRYESIRQKHHGVGMSEVDVRKKSCGACGTSLPTRTIEALKEDKLVTCESCHRILYYTEGVV